MTARDTFVTSVKNASLAKAASDLNAEMVKQITINQSGCDVGLKLQNGNAAFVTATKNAANAAAASLLANEQTKQTTINVAKDVLKQSGDLGSA